MRTCFLTLFFSGKVPKAQGTAGSILALLLGIPLLLYSLETLFLLAILIGVIAIKQIDIYEREHKIHDAKEIVIDELVGMWLAMAIGGIYGTSGAMLYWVLGFSFVFFRIFDICKPSVIGKIDRELKGGLGVVCDDALAGVFAGLSTLLALKLLSFSHLLG